MLIKDVVIDVEKNAVELLSAKVCAASHRPDKAAYQLIADP
jgi:hypothetical protein